MIIETEIRIPTTNKIESKFYPYLADKMTE